VSDEDLPVGLVGHSLAVADEQPVDLAVWVRNG
jgi:hypothetical protein